MWSGLGQIYVGMHDGTLHAFGFNDERRAIGAGDQIGSIRDGGLGLRAAALRLTGGSRAPHLSHSQR